MQITILSTGTALDLPDGLTLNIERPNPLLTEDEGLTLPATLPLTSTNRRALGLPDRPDVLVYDEREDEYYYNTFPPVEVFLDAGLYRQRGLLSILSATTETVEVSIALDASFAWSRLEGVTVAEVLGNSYTGAGDPDQLIQTLEQCIRLARTTHQDVPYELADIFRVAPIVRTADADSDDSDTRETMLCRYYSADVIREDEPQADADTGEIHEYCCFPLNARKSSSGRYLYATAHLRLEYVLRRIFDYAGMPLTVSLPTNLPAGLTGFARAWEDICLVNNTLDAAYSGRLYYRSLVPADLTAKDLLRAVCAQFGAYFVPTPDGMEMRFLCDLLSGPTAEIDCEGLDILSTTFNDPPSRDWRSDMEELTVPAATVAVFAGTPVTQQTNWTQHLNQYALALEGFCQRVTTSADDDGNDNTQTTPCPFTLAYITPVEVDMGNMDAGWPGYRGTRLRTPMALPVPVPPLRGDWPSAWEDAATICSAQQAYTLNNPDAMAERFNRLWDAAVRQGMHRLTATLTLTRRQLDAFDMTQPVLLHGRRCLPVSLTGTLADTDLLTFTLEAVTI